MHFRSSQFGILYPRDADRFPAPYLMSITGGLGSIRRLGDILLPGLILDPVGGDIAEIDDPRAAVGTNAEVWWVTLRTLRDTRTSRIILTDYPRGLDVYLFGAYCTPEREAALRQIGFRRA